MNSSNKKQQSNQAGFLKVVVLLVLVAGIGAGVYFFVLKKDTNKQEQTKQTATEAMQPEATAPVLTDKNSTNYTNTKYGFEFMYPKEWGSIEPLTASPPALFAAITKPQNAYKIASITVAPIAGFTVGGGFGAELKYNPVNSEWQVNKQGKFAVEQAVGEAFPLPNTTNARGLKVFTYTSGDGPFKETSLLFLKNGNIVHIELPSVCPDPTCADYQNSYTSEQIQTYAKSIIESIQVTKD